MNDEKESLKKSDVKYVPFTDYAKQNKSLPGRESQMEEILSFVKTKLCDRTSG